MGIFDISKYSPYFIKLENIMVYFLSLGNFRMKTILWHLIAGIKGMWIWVWICACGYGKAWICESYFVCGNIDI